MDLFLLLLQYTLIYAAVLSLVALGGMFSEHSGVINLGLEGVMVIGALGGALAMRFLPSSIPGFVGVILVILISAISGVLYSMLLAVACIRFKADQTITGTALNIMATALATVVVKAITLKLDGKATPILSYIEFHEKFVINWGSFTFDWFMPIMVVAVIISFIVLYKTKFGLRLMACGEHPQAADSVGVNVIKFRYIGVGISGVLGGLGGLCYIVAAGSGNSFDMGVAGFGFLALAVMIFGQWKPINIFLGSILFGFFRTLGLYYTDISFLNSLGISSWVYKMLPYIVCLVVLMFTSKNSRAPKAEGIPYDKGQR